MKKGAIILLLIIFTLVSVFCITISTIENVTNVCTCDEAKEIYTTSDYDWFRAQYKTISKCSKCGLVVE